MAQQELQATDSVRDALLTKQESNNDELYLIKTEVENARGGEANLKAQIDALQASILAVTAANGSLISAEDTTPGYLYGKAVAGTGITLTKGNGGGNETLTISGEDASTSNKGIASFNQYDHDVSSGAVSIKQHTPTTKTQADDGYSVTANDLRGNIIFINTGASGSCNLNLPASTAGARCGIYVAAAQTFGFTANGSEVFRNDIHTGSAGGTLTARRIGSFAWIECIISGQWLVDWRSGIWKYS